MANLKTDYKDDILDSTKNIRRKFRMITNDDGTFSFEDVTDYLQYGDSFGALDLNAITNAIMSECLKRTDVVDNLESTATNLPLSANKGREIKEQLNCFTYTKEILDTSEESKKNAIVDYMTSSFANINGFNILTLSYRETGGRYSYLISGNGLGNFYVIEMSWYLDSIRCYKYAAGAWTYTNTFNRTVKSVGEGLVLESSGNIRILHFNGEQVNAGLLQASLTNDSLPKIPIRGNGFTQTDNGFVGTTLSLSPDGSISSFYLGGTQGITGAVYGQLMWVV